MIIQCLECLSPIQTSPQALKYAASKPDFASVDLLKLKGHISCTSCSHGSPNFRLIDKSFNTLGDTRATPICKKCNKVMTFSEFNKSLKTACLSNNTGCSRCKTFSNDSLDIATKPPEMIEFLGYFLPFNESFFSTWILKALINEKCAGYQNQHRNHALKFVRNFDVAVDIGGHWGLWTRPLLSKFKTVHAFEPNPNSLPFLKANAPDALIYPFGLSNDLSTQHLNINVRQSGGAFIDTSPNADTIPIEVRTLDSFNIDKIDFIKMDCEGFELEAVMGGIETIKRTQPIINLEQKPNHTETRGKDKLAAVNFLIKECNYQILGNYIDEWVVGPK